MEVLAQALQTVGYVDVKRVSLRSPLSSYKSQLEQVVLRDPQIKEDVQFSHLPPQCHWPFPTHV